MADLFHFVAESSAHIIVMALPETLDSADFDRLNETMLGMIDTKPSKSWVIDLSGVQYLGSAMLGLMVNFRQRVQAQKGRLALCEISPRLMEIIRTCCMDRLFKIAKTRSEAIKQVK